MEDDIKRYLVTMDGYHGYGSEIYFVGIFKTKEEAENGMKECLKYAKLNNVNVDENCYEIHEVDEGFWHYPHPEHYENDAKTDIYLGGYIE